MVNLYLFIELLHTASAVTTVDTLKALKPPTIASSPTWWCCLRRRSWPSSTARTPPTATR